MIRIVLDTNVLVSGLLSERGAPGLILDMALSGELSLIFDSRIIAEYYEVLARPKLKLDPALVQEVLKVLMGEGESGLALPWPFPMPDSDDAIFLSVAQRSQADCLVTGNLRHFPPASRGGVKVLSPRDFVEWLRTKK